MLSKLEQEGVDVSKVWVAHSQFPSLILFSFPVKVSVSFFGSEGFGLRAEQDVAESEKVLDIPHRYSFIDTLIPLNFHFFDSDLYLQD